MAKRQVRPRHSRLDQTTESIWLRLVSRLSSIVAPVLLGLLVWFVQHEITTLEDGITTRSKALWEQIGKMVTIENETVKQLSGVAQKVDDHQKADDHDAGLTQRYLDNIDRKLQDLGTKRK